MMTMIMVVVVVMMTMVIMLLPSSRLLLFLLPCYSLSLLLIFFIAAAATVVVVVAFISVSRCSAVAAIFLFSHFSTFHFVQPLLRISWLLPTASIVAVTAVIAFLVCMVLLVLLMYCHCCSVVVDVVNLGQLVIFFFVLPFGSKSALCCALAFALLLLPPAGLLLSGVGQNFGS